MIHVTTTGPPYKIELAGNGLGWGTSCCSMYGVPYSPEMEKICQQVRYGPPETCTQVNCGENRVIDVTGNCDPCGPAV